MPQYMIAVGYDVALEDLDPIDPQPSSIGMEHGRRSYAASGIVVDELAHVNLEWSAFDIEDYQSILAQFGLTTATTAQVSVYVQDENYGWILRNAIAVKPLIGSEGQRDNFFLRSFVILIKNLTVQA